MKTVVSNILLITAALHLFSCKTPHTNGMLHTEKTESSELSQAPFDLLKSYMAGQFSSQVQSQQDSDFFDIRLRMEPVHRWNNSGNEFYLYVEQAMAATLQKPYRQRMYKVVADDETHFTSQIYLLPNASRFIGKSGNDSLFTILTADSLELKAGCEVHLTYDSSKRIFAGSTRNRTCPSERSGASWTSSEVTISKDGMVSWDRGWNTTGEQVWGAKKGGYDFKKLH
jgi:CpeT protein